jgi:hypothetical protein
MSNKIAAATRAPISPSSDRTTPVLVETMNLLAPLEALYEAAQPESFVLPPELRVL